MTTELTWLALTCLFTAVMWVPYILNRISTQGLVGNRISTQGLVGALGYPQNPKPIPAWAERLKKAHYNSIENLVVFGLLVVIAHIANIHSSVTVAACVVYFWARLAYAVVYTLGIPVARTLTFAVSSFCSLAMAAAVLL